MSNGKTPANILTELCAQQHYQLFITFEEKINQNRNKEFLCHIRIDNKQSVGKSTTKKKAKQEASSKMLNILTHGAHPFSEEGVSDSSVDNNSQFVSSNYIGKLMTLVIRHKKPPPKFETTVNPFGGFTCKITVDNLTVTGNGRSKKEAKQQSAKEMMDKIFDFNLDKLQETEPVSSRLDVVGEAFNNMTISGGSNSNTKNEPKVNAVKPNCNASALSNIVADSIEEESRKRHSENLRESPKVNPRVTLSIGTPMIQNQTTIKSCHKPIQYFNNNNFPDNNIDNNNIKNVNDVNENKINNNNNDYYDDEYRKRIPEFQGGDDFHAVDLMQNIFDTRAAGGSRNLMPRHPFPGVELLIDPVIRRNVNDRSDDREETLIKHLADDNIDEDLVVNNNLPTIGSVFHRRYNHSDEDEETFVKCPIVNNNIDHTVYDAVNNTVNDTVNDEVKNTINYVVKNTVNDEVKNTVNYVVKNTVKDAVNDEAGTAVMDEIECDYETIAVNLMQKLSEIHKLKYHAIKLNDETPDGEMQCLLKLSTYPVSVFQGRGTTYELAYCNAVENAFSYLNLLAYNPIGGIELIN